MSFIQKHQKDLLIVIEQLQKAEVFTFVEERKHLGLRELCSKSSSLCYSEFPQKLYHYAHYYSQNLLIILIILNFTAILFQLFFTFTIKMCNNTL